MPSRRGLLSDADFFFHGIGSGKLSIAVGLGARGARMQFANFPDRCTASVTRHG